MYMNSNEGRGPPGTMSYGKPRLSRLGTFRELTRSGGTAFTDMFIMNSSGCVMTSSTSYTCTSP
jgi:hypothetical protein